MTEGAGGVSIQNTVSSFDPVLQASETDLARAQEAAQSGRTGDIMNLEAQLHQWTLTLQVKANVLKAIKDAFQNIIRNYN
ncbi:MAG: hypothetical protein GDA54_03650 [Alphaproteobacteria bacterium GM7ARS4]|nr:hypothetical protein [Alphaproteobacteria bacterium GM7ARS4]